MIEIPWIGRALYLDYFASYLQEKDIKIKDINDLGIAVETLQQNPYIGLIVQAGAMELGKGNFQQLSRIENGDTTGLIYSFLKRVRTFPSYESTPIVIPHTGVRDIKRLMIDDRIYLFDLTGRGNGILERFGKCVENALKS